MEVVVEKQQIVFDGHALEYYAYYFKIWNENVDHRITVKKVLDQWASALESLGENRVVFLPYYLDDQMSKALKAELVGKDIRLVITRVDYDGWAFNLDDLCPRVRTKLQTSACTNLNTQNTLEVTLQSIWSRH